MARAIPSEVIRHFRLIPLFSSVSKKGLRAIVQAATEIDVPAGTRLVRQGDWGRELYVIVRGTATVSIDGKNMRELVPGDFFGELAFLHPAPRTADVTAHTDMRVMVLGSRELDVIVEREPIIAKRLMEAMAQRVRQNEPRQLTH